MPVVKTKSGYRYGKTGKVYKSKAKAVKQGQTIRLSQIRCGRGLNKTRATLRGGFCPIERSLNILYNSLNADLTEKIQRTIRFTYVR